MDSKSVIGRWRIMPDSIGSFGDYAMEFTRQGELVYTYFNSTGRINSRSLLIYRIKGNLMITDQPSKPHEERTFMWFEGEKLILIDNGLTVAFTRETVSSDPEAYMMALSSSAVQHALESAHTDAPFIPFLIADIDQVRTLVRFVTETPQQALQSAREFILTKKDSLKACSYAYDGYLNVDGKRSDAVIVEVSQHGLEHGLILAQPYVMEHDKAVRIGIINMQTAESWLKWVG